MEEEGGYDLSFVDKVTDHLICIICQLVIRKPVSFIDCGHRMCQSCYLRIKGDSDHRNTPLLCPHDRSVVDATKVFEDKGMARMIGDLKVKCKHADEECGWVGELSNLENHLSKFCIVVERENEREDPLHILKIIQERLLTCEIEVVKNKEEISTLKEEIGKNKEEITVLKEEVRKSKVEIESLKEENVQKDKIMKLIKENLSLTENELVGVHKKILSINMKIATDEKVVTDEEVELSGVELAMKCHTRTGTPIIDKIQNDVVDMKNSIYDIDTKISKFECDIKMLEHLTANKAVVFKWKMTNYKHHKENGEVFCPKFYSHMHGDCYQMRVKWNGAKKGRIDFTLFCSARDDGTVSDYDNIDYGIQIIAHSDDDDDDEVMEPLRFPCALLLSSESFHIDKSTGRSNVGWGPRNFLNTPRLNNFIRNDSMYFTVMIIPQSSARLWAIHK